MLLINALALEESRASIYSVSLLSAACHACHFLATFVQTCCSD